MSDETQTYWISKYALSGGVVAKAGYASNTEGYVRVVGWGTYRLGRDAHLTEAEANATAEKMRLKRIASLRKQFVKLEAMRFT